MADKWTNPEILVPDYEKMWEYVTIVPVLLKVSEFFLIISYLFY